MIRRRAFLVGGSAALVGGGVARAKEKDEDEVSPTEDLMREHGVLRRILLVYGEAARRLDAKQELPSGALAQAATIVREFIEDYHERDEEEYVFPALEKAHKLGELVATLRAQHQAGRRLTEEIRRAPSAATLRKFIRMYEPHAAFEDTVLFPTFRSLVGSKQLDKLKAIFEDKEKALPHGGFEKMVDAVAKIEVVFGVHDLAKFTP
jgi:hemerythrin-like domain-containing protein